MHSRHRDLSHRATKFNLCDSNAKNITEYAIKVVSLKTIWIMKIRPQILVDKIHRFKNMGICLKSHLEVDIGPCHFKLPINKMSFEKKHPKKSKYIKLIWDVSVI